LAAPVHVGRGRAAIRTCWIETTSMVVNATSSQHHRQRLALAGVLLGQEQEVGLKSKKEECRSSLLVCNLHSQQTRQLSKKRTKKKEEEEVMLAGRALALGVTCVGAAQIHPLQKA